MVSMNSIRDTFFEECEELLETLSEGLERIDSGNHDSETVNAVFRAVHSIKGGAGAFALTDLVAFAHRFETLLDGVRGDNVVLTPDVIHTLLRSADHLADLVEAARHDGQVPPDQTAGFLAALDASLSTGSDMPDAEFGDSFDFAALPLDFGNDPAAPPELAGYLIDFRPHPVLYENGHEPALLIAALAELGTLEPTLNLDALAGIDNLDPGLPALAWTIRLLTAESETTVHEVFEFVQGLCDLDIRPLPVGDPAPGPVPAPERPALSVPDPAGAPVAAVAVAATTPPAMPARVATKAEDSDGDARGPKTTLRVDLDRVDRLINAVGELIINQAMISQCLRDLELKGDSDVISHVEDYRLLARDIQEAVMAIRAQPVKPLFQRMSRIVREAADATSKVAQLVTTGDSTEVDKTVIERLADPLTHMIRNALDHGLEKPDERAAAGKDRTGTIHLSAAHRSGSVVITIRDDGAGLNRKRILETARNKGLVAADADLADAAIDNLLFMPGFSTASTISNLSGRGVGLDVVRNAVAELGGRISISTMPGQGTEFTLSLPLTLAVMDGMVVSVAGQTMVVPITSIIETIRPENGDIHEIGTDDRVLATRGRYIPVVDVARSLGLPLSDLRRKAPLLLLVETENQSQCALVVDAVHDQRQVVIKGLDSNYGAVPGVSAATILGDGQIALILDTDAIAASGNGAAMAPAMTEEGFSHVTH